MASSTDQSHAALEAFGGEPGVVSLYGYENVTIIVWHARPTLPAAQQLSRVSQRRRTEFPHGISVVHLVQKSFEMPDAVTRGEFVRLLRDGGGKLAVLCVVLAEGGFWASAMRSLVTGLRVLSRESFDLSLHTDIAETVEYLQPRHLAKTGVTLRREEFASILTKLFAPS